MPHSRSIRRRLAYHRFVARHAAWVVGGSVVLAGVLFAAALRLELRTDLTELLPADHPAVVALRTVAPRQRSASSLAVLVEGDDPARASAFVAAARPRLEALLLTTLTQIDWGPDPEPAAFARRWRWLYAPLADLAEAKRLAEAVIAKRSSPLYVDFDEEEPSTALQRLDAEMRSHLPDAPARTQFSSADGRTLGIRLWRRRDGLGGVGDHETLAAVQRVLASLPRDGVRIHYTGPIAQAVEEQAAIRDDLSLATLACAVLILAALWLAFGRAALVLAALWPTLLGLLVALALAAGTLGSLNLNTAFLVSIILGNGINAPIVVLGELHRQRRRGLSMARAIPRAFAASTTGIVAALLAAAVSYGVLGTTRFRGFQQFGLIGGVGMVAVLLSTFIVLPALLHLLDRLAPRLVRVGRDRFSAPVTRVIEGMTRKPHATYLVAALSLLALVGVVRFAKNPVEWNLRTLRSRAGEATRLWDDMEALGMGSVGAGYIANTAVLLVDDPSQADRVADALRDQDRHGDRILATVRTLGSLLPSEQAKKLVALADLRRLVDRQLTEHDAMLTAADRARLRDCRPPDDLRAIDVSDLPRGVREAFTEIDGTRGRLVGIDADGARYHDWDGHMLLELSRALRVVVDGKVYEAASAATVFAGMLSTLLDDAPQLSALALGLVLLLFVVVFGRRAPFVAGALLLGLFWLAGAAGLGGLRLNFMSFAAIPISIGVGADYAANLWSRRADHADVGATVVLCSLTTIIGYSSLLVGRNGALRSFGVLCDTGEITCLLAALFFAKLSRGGAQ